MCEGSITYVVHKSVSETLRYFMQHEVRKLAKYIINLHCILNAYQICLHAFVSNLYFYSSIFITCVSLLEINLDAYIRIL